MCTIFVKTILFLSNLINYLNQQNIHSKLYSFIQSHPINELIKYYLYFVIKSASKENMINIGSQLNILKEGFSSLSQDQTNINSKVVNQREVLQKQVAFLKSQLQALTFQHPTNLSSQITHQEPNNQQQSHTKGHSDKSLFINQSISSPSQKFTDKQKPLTKMIEKQPMQSFRVGRIVRNISSKKQNSKQYQTIELHNVGSLELGNMGDKPNLWFSNNKMQSNNRKNALDNNRIGRQHQSIDQRSSSGRFKLNTTRHKVTLLEQQSLSANKPHSQSYHSRNQSPFPSKEISTNSSINNFAQSCRLRSRLINRNKSIQSNIERERHSEYHSHGKIIKNNVNFYAKSSNFLDSINLQHEINISKQQIPNKQFSLSSLPYFIDTPHQKSNKSEIISLTIKIAKKLSISELKQEDLQRIVIKKYKNCLIFKIPQTNKKVIWFFQGKFYFGEGDKQGDQGFKSGEGIQYVPQKSFYKGQFLQNKKTGKGVMIGSDGNIYEGQWLQGHYHGRGKFFNNQTQQIYEGEFKRDKFDGFGILKISESEVYKGEFVNDEKNGFGIQLLKNGDQYKGNYQKGQFDGIGRYIWTDGSYYEGEFRKGVRTGHGRWCSSVLDDGESYVGMFVNEKKHGFGRYKWRDGSVYEGEFECDRKHGKGLIIYKGSKSITGRWENNRLVEVWQSQSLNHDAQIEIPDNIRLELQNMDSLMLA